MVELKKILDLGYEEVIIHDFLEGVVSKRFISIEAKKKYWFNKISSVVTENDFNTSPYASYVFKNVEDIHVMYAEVKEFVIIKDDELGNLCYENLASKENPSLFIMCEIFMKIHQNTVNLYRTTRTLTTNSDFELVYEEDFKNYRYCIYDRISGVFYSWEDEEFASDAKLDEMHRSIYYNKFKTAAHNKVERTNKTYIDLI